MADLLTNSPKTNQLQQITEQFKSALETGDKQTVNMLKSKILPTLNQEQMQRFNDLNRINDQFHIQKIRSQPGFENVTASDILARGDIPGMTSQLQTMQPAPKPVPLGADFEPKNLKERAVKQWAIDRDIPIYQANIEYEKSLKEKLEKPEKYEYGEGGAGIAGQRIEKGFKPKLIAGGKLQPLPKKSERELKLESRKAAIEENKIINAANRIKFEREKLAKQGKGESPSLAFQIFKSAQKIAQDTASKDATMDEVFARIEDIIEKIKSSAGFETSIASPEQALSEAREEGQAHAPAQPTQQPQALPLPEGVTEEQIQATIRLRPNETKESIIQKINQARQGR